MKTVIHTIENNTQIFTNSTRIDCNKKNINAIAFKVVGTGTCMINSMPVDANDGIVSFSNGMAVKDVTNYDVIIPANTVVYVVTTNILRSEAIEIFDRIC
jgi:hypothetical protein